MTTADPFCQGKADCGWRQSDCHALPGSSTCCVDCTHGPKPPVVAYLSARSTWHPECLVQVLIGDTALSPAAAEMSPAEALHQWVEANALIPDNVDYPHPLTAAQARGRECRHCCLPLEV